MAFDIITAERQLAELIATPAKAPIGRAAKPFASTELAPVVNKHPDTYEERQQRFYQLKREQLLVPVDESFEFVEFEPEYSEQDAYTAFEAINWGA